MPKNNQKKQSFYKSKAPVKYLKEAWIGRVGDDMLNFEPCYVCLTLSMDQLRAMEEIQLHAVDSFKMELYGLEVLINGKLSRADKVFCQIISPVLPGHSWGFQLLMADVAGPLDTRVIRFAHPCLIDFQEFLKYCEAEPQAKKKSEPYLWIDQSIVDTLDSLVEDKPELVQSNMPLLNLAKDKGFIEFNFG